MRFYILICILCISLTSCSSMTITLQESPRYQNFEKQVVEDKFPIVIAFYDIVGHNYVGGVDVKMIYRNISSKAIKYINISTCFINNVNDIVVNEIGGNPFASLKITGPINTGEFKSSYWEAVFYNKSATKAIITSLTITYMDNSKFEINDTKKIQKYVANYWTQSDFGKNTKIKIYI